MKIELIAGTLFCIVILVGTVILWSYIVKILYATIRAIFSLIWPSVTGKIISVGVNESLGDDDDVWYEPKILYRYIIRGVEYESTRINFLFWSSLDRREVDYELSMFTGSDDIKIYYNPFNPSSSVLHTGINDKYITQFGLCFYILFFLVPLTAMSYLIIKELYYAYPSFGFLNP